MAGLTLIANSECSATVQGAKVAGGFVGSITDGAAKLDGCKLTGSVTGETVGEWAASGTATTTNCTKG